MCLAVPGKVVAIAEADDPLRRNGKVDFGGVLRAVSLALVPEAEIGHYVLVHAGLALSTLDEEEALAVLDDFRRMEELAAAEEAAAEEAAGAAEET